MNMKRVIVNSTLLISLAVLSGCCTFCDEVRTKCGPETMKVKQGDRFECVPDWETVCGPGTVRKINKDHIPSNAEGEGGVGGERECVSDSAT